VLIVDDLFKSYLSGGQPLAAVRNVSFRVDAGETVAIVGASGSGKTTLLGLMAGLDAPSSGRVTLDGTDLGALEEDQRARLRRERIGFVFQAFQLIPTLTARENVEVPLQLRGERATPRAEELLARVGLAGRGHHFPAQLSGGEQQRVAIARAFVHSPQILFADEPTGNLDAATGLTVIELLMELNREQGTTLVLVTHDSDLAARTRRVIRLADGQVVSDTRGAA
jgi:putative ABC transport system ATP-binding protein